ncbi:MAG TPA: PEP-CTERM sorting domain-containing protein [Verrucomicrobiae bacterium]|nr:PEP-CTERM sorting domain-containing protein [Verrucomicrobiae bacterium]
MKKSVVIAALGLAIGAVSSFAQGSIQFNSYFANGSAGILTHFGGPLGNGLVGAGYTADLLWSLSPITDTAGNGSLNAGWNFSSTSVQSVATPFGTTPSTLGYFQSPQNFFLNPYTAGTTVYFEVIAYQTGSTYANSQNRGHSDSFSAVLTTGLSTPGFVAFNPFTVTPVPEPATLALAGLGGLASLVMLRRKKA